MGGLPSYSRCMICFWPAEAPAKNVACCLFNSGPILASRVAELDGCENLSPCIPWCEDLPLLARAAQPYWALLATTVLTSSGVVGWLSPTLPLRLFWSATDYRHERRYPPWSSPRFIPCPGTIFWTRISGRTKNRMVRHHGKLKVVVKVFYYGVISQSCKHNCLFFDGTRTRSEQSSARGCSSTPARARAPTGSTQTQQVKQLVGLKEVKLNSARVNSNTPGKNEDAYAQRRRSIETVVVDCCFYFLLISQSR